jgi:hypothetical protein
MPTLWEGTSVISLGLAYRRKTTDYNQYSINEIDGYTTKNKIKIKSLEKMT